MKVRIGTGNPNGGHHVQDVGRFTTVEYVLGDRVLFQVTVDDSPIPTLRVRAVEGLNVPGDGYHGNALTILPEVSNSVCLQLRRQRP